MTPKLIPWGLWDILWFLAMQNISQQVRRSGKMVTLQESTCQLMICRCPWSFRRRWWILNSAWAGGEGQLNVFRGWYSCTLKTEWEPWDTTKFVPQEIYRNVFGTMPEIGMLRFTFWILIFNGKVSYHLFFHSSQRNFCKSDWRSNLKIQADRCFDLLQVSLYIFNISLKLPLLQVLSGIPSFYGKKYFRICKWIRNC